MSKKKQASRRPANATAELGNSNAGPQCAAEAANPASGQTGGQEARAPKGKLGAIADLLKRPHGATIEQLMNATGWQSHSVRGAMAGALTKKHGLIVTSEKTDIGRIYRAERGVDR